LTPDPSSEVALIASDLNALARVEAACRSAGRELRRAQDVEAVVSGLPPALVLVDLDEGGPELVGALAEALRSGRLTGPVVGFFSHVDAETGRIADAAGLRALPRGRFWRELADLVAHA
jgi:hypothetical protein